MHKGYVHGLLTHGYSNTGWKVAYCLAPAELMAEFRKVHQFLVFTVHAPSQYALAEFMQRPGWYEQLKALYQGKRDISGKPWPGHGLNSCPARALTFNA